MNIVDVRQLTKYYGKSRGIEDVTFSITEGEVFGFIGPNGAGKSTTIRTLLNFIYPSSGSASIFGKDVVADSREIRQSVGYLPSEVHYYDDMKVNDLLRYSAGFYGSLNPERIKHLTHRLDLDTSRKIEDLSFGNRKKVGIVQALLHEPRLLILDEPTGGLDPLMQHTFFELLAEERAKGVTVFFSSHILSEVQKFCDRVAVIKDGTLIQVETVENLTRNQFRKITIEFDETDQHDMDTVISQAEGVMQSERTGRTLHLLFNGDLKSLLSRLQMLPFTDLKIEEPSLEEVFMHVYTKGTEGETP